MIEEKDVLKVIDIDDILRILPHRYPFLLLDKVLITETAKSGIGVKNVTINEPFFQGHFPSFPIMPGVLLIEALAQTSGVIILDSLEDTRNKETIFMSVEKAKFRTPVRPGDVLKLYVEKEQERRDIYRFKGVAKVDGKTVAEAVYTAVIHNKKQV